MFLSDHTSGFNALSADEHALLARLLSRPFQGSPELRRQCAGLLGKQLDANGSLRLGVTVPRSAAVDRRIPVEASYLDDDGVRVHILLHVVDGYLDEFEVYREDSGQVLRSHVLLGLHGGVSWVQT